MSDRLYLKCSVCNEKILLAKSYSSPYFTFYNNSELCDKLNTFFENHYCCEFGKNTKHLYGEFELEYEE